ncbi:hypothetical protein MUK42_33638 [Musa troglodytarum]|uniref:Hydroxyproline-rich glycoprotein family protein n=1 Tax=Musa troglodytarum TaxID=320322 RepID=A0A9E7HPX3_9LILI|nr:hypothetical protein MUK42_33638 [Musa troglodytarum]
MQPAVIGHAVPAPSVLHRRPTQEGKVLQKGSARAATAKKEVGGVKRDSELEGTLKSKILRLRHNLDLPRPNASPTLHELLLATLEDLEKFYDKCMTSIQISNSDRGSPAQVLLQFYKVLKLAGDLWVEKCCESEKITFEEADVEDLKFEQLGALVLNRLDRMNIHIKEMFDLMKKDSASTLKSGEDLIKPDHCDKPQSPTSVLLEPSEVNPNLEEAKILPTCHLFSILYGFRLLENHRSKAVTETENITDELELDSLDATMVLKPISYAEIRSDGHADGSETDEDAALVSTPPASSSLPSDMFESSRPGTLRPTCTEQVSHAVNINRDGDDGSKTSDSTILVPPTLPILRVRATHLSPTPTPPPSPMLLTGIPWFFGSPRQQSGMEMEPVAYAMAIDDSDHVCTCCEPSETSFSVSPQSSSAASAPKIQTSFSPPSPQLSSSPSLLSKSAPVPPVTSPPRGCVLPASPPPPCASSNQVPSLPSPKASAPPPPPPLSVAKAINAKKTSTKLKRSTQMGSLYRLLKGKVEGSSLDGKASSGRKGQTGSCSDGKKSQGMADALAEMTKRSSINSFETKDMKDLLKFHQHVEQQLENLTDETQVLARFEGFPSKKLETVRMAAALYMKLESVVATLKGWSLAAPIAQQLAKVECYFNKIKEGMEVVERNKEEDSKRFKNHKIEFDFTVLVRIKEGMVDLSSDCIEMALKKIFLVLLKTTREFSYSTFFHNPDLTLLFILAHT